MCAGIQPVDPIFRSDWSLIPDFDSSRRLVCIQAHGLYVLFGPHVAVIPSGWAWPEPTDRSNKRHAVLSSIRAVARFFQSPSVIFLPDDIKPWCDADEWIADGATFNEFRQRLAKIKAPSPDFRAAIRQMPDCYEVNGYVIEELDYDEV